MKFLLLVTLLLSAYHCATALTKSEIEGLEYLSDAWNGFASGGHQWGYVFEKACEPVPWKFLTCSPGPDPHVIALYGLKNRHLSHKPFFCEDVKTVFLPSSSLKPLTITDNASSDPSKRLIKDYGASGTIPEAIDKLQWLERLEVTNSGLSGTIPSSIGNLSNLKSLRLESVPMWTGHQHNSHQLDTTIPASIANLTMLERFELMPAQLHGTFPSPWPKLSKLQHFSIISRDQQLLTISGSLPNFWQDHPELKSLVLDHTAITGIMGYQHTNMYSLPALETLQLTRNPLLRLITSSFHMPLLKTLELSSNPYVTGNLAFLNTLPSLEVIKISETHHTGTLQDSFWKTRNLSIIWIDSPSLSGSISPSVGDLTNLTDLCIASPFFHGIIPDTIGNCKQLRRIKLLNGRFSAPLPPSLGSLSNLEDLHIAKTQPLGSIPDTIGLLSNLVRLQLRSCGLNGTIPISMSESFHPHLDYLDLSDNMLEGQIPNLTCATCILSRNLLTGTVPPSMGANAEVLQLDNNHLGPDLASNTFKEGRAVRLELDLSFNDFECLLPDMDFNAPFQPASSPTFRFSHNRFFGAISSTMTGTHVYLDHNHLGGDDVDVVPFLLHASIHTLDISYNNFSGTISSLTNGSSILWLHLAHNNFSGTLPLLPAGLKTLDLSHNHFDEPLSVEFFHNIQSLSLTDLDLSFNQIQCPPLPFYPYELLNSTIKILNLKNNSFDCLFHPDTSRDGRDSLVLRQSSIVFLDLSHNEFRGLFTLSSFTTLSVLDISFNQFSGDFAFHSLRFPVIAQLDISSNSFVMDASSITNMPYLHTFAASNNYVKGFLSPINVPNLENLDLSDNRLDEQPSLVALGDLFSQYALKILSIQSNALIPPFKSYNNSNTGLTRTSLSSPSSTQEGVVCFTVAFHNATTSNFLFDEGLFSWTQCDCDASHFGLPPDRCHQCPKNSGVVGSGVVACGGKEMIIAENAFAYLPYEKNWDPSRKREDPSSRREYNPPNSPTSTWVTRPPTDSSKREDIPPNSPNSPDSPDSPNPPIDDGSPFWDTRPPTFEPPRSLHFETESCLVLPEQELMHTSGCGGIRLTAEDLTPNSMAIHILKEQCSPGAAGRLCSRCSCDIQYEEDCYYEKALKCVKCKHIFSMSQSLGLFFGLLILTIIIGTIGMLLVLRNRRVQKTVPWKNLSKLKKTFHRLLYLSSLGYISILITFVQMFVELTHWDAYATINVLQLMNLNSEGLGLRCLFPIFADPTFDLWIRLSIPFAALVLIFICVVLAEMLSRFLTRCNYRRTARRVLHGSSAIRPYDNYSPIATLSDSVDNDAEWISRHGSISDFGSLNSNNSEIWTPLAELDSYTSITVHYPMLALLTSVSIMAIKFFYFGTALTAHTYFFSQVQAYTHTRYVQNMPWMKADHALNEQWSSIPMAIIFDFLLPLGFLFLCYRLRKTFTSPSVTMYVGNLFESFTAKCYWWEIVNIFKKLSVALALRAFPASDALQSMIIISIIAGLQVIQVSLNPWKRRAENVMDSISAVLLIAALIAARNGSLKHSTASAYSVLAVACVYVVMSIGLIVFETLTGKTDYEKRYDKWSELKTEPNHNVEESQDELLSDPTMDGSESE